MSGSNISAYITAYVYTWLLLLVFLLWRTCDRLDRLAKMSMPYKWCKTILAPNNGVKINHAETGHLYLNDV